MKKGLTKEEFESLEIGDEIHFSTGNNILVMEEIDRSQGYPVISMAWKRISSVYIARFAIGKAEKKVVNSWTSSLELNYCDLEIRKKGINETTPLS